MRLTLSTKFRIKKGILTKFVNEKAFILDSEKAEVRSLNETASFIWRNLKKGTPIKEIIESVTDEYKVDEATAKKDVLNLLKKYLKEGLIAVRKK
ncbi:PqqD family protein [Patescibacteria group bacterium]|nr:PqqD family protein [Patescibacteria group bacterium]